MNASLNIGGLYLEIETGKKWRVLFFEGRFVTLVHKGEKVTILREDIPKVLIPY